MCLACLPDCPGVVPRPGAAATQCSGDVGALAPYHRHEGLAAPWQVIGREHLPANDEPAVYVANHQSFLVRARGPTAPAPSAHTMRRARAQPALKHKPCTAGRPPWRGTS